MKTTINILIIGKTGVGKSSFCNYIFGEKLFNTGTGKPITQANEHFQSRQISYDKLNLNLIDTVGIETDNFTKLRNSLNTFIQKRNGNPSTAPQDWVHGVFYLINATSARLEETEIALLHSLKEQQIPIHVILTNIDTAGESKISALKKTILQEKLVDSTQYINEVCSVSIKTRGGMSSTQMGKEAVFKSFFLSLDTRLKRLIIYYHLINTLHLVQLSKNKAVQSIKKADLGAINLIKSAINDELNTITEYFDQLQEEENLEKYSQYAQEIDHFLSSINYKYNTSITDEIRAHEQKIESLLDTGLQSFKTMTDDIDAGLNSDSLWDKIVAGTKATKLLFTLESTILDHIDIALDPILDYLKSEIRNYDSINCNSEKDIALMTQLPGLQGPLYAMLKR